MMKMKPLTFTLLLSTVHSFISPVRIIRNELFYLQSSATDDDSPRIADFALDPSSSQARSIVVDHLELSEDQYDKLVQLSHLVTDWNQRINLVSRKDCSPSTVFGRHILPSLACCALTENPLPDAQNVVDVGTGGGFPGLPLAITYPSINFLLLDSVGKKLTAVQDMAEALALTNVQTHHGRAEDFRQQQFDVATGRSVSAIPQFCAWMQHLLRKDTGRLLYWIGGDIDDEILGQTVSDTPIDRLVPELESDKRILVFPQSAVHRIAKDSGIVVRPTNVSSKKKKSNPKNSKQTAKGAWRKKDPNQPKQRGYEDFQRYSSN